MTLANQVQSWHDVYLTAGSGAAALAGLLFVGLSLHIRTVISHPDVRALARVTLSAFFGVLTLALFMLSPNQGSQTTGYTTIGIGLAGLILIARPAWAGIRTRRSQALGLRTLILRFGISAVSQLVIAAAGLMILATTDYADALQLLLVAVVVLMVVAVRNTWDLLVTVADR